jgi:hypothetical protein
MLCKWGRKMGGTSKSSQIRQKEGSSAGIASPIACAINATKTKTGLTTDQAGAMAGIAMLRSTRTAAQRTALRVVVRCDNGD